MGGAVVGPLEKGACTAWSNTAQHNYCAVAAIFCCFECVAKSLDQEKTKTKIISSCRHQHYFLFPRMKETLFILLLAMSLTFGE